MTKPNLKFSLRLRILKILPEFIISRSMQGFYMSDFHNLKKNLNFMKFGRKFRRKKIRRTKKEDITYFSIFGGENFISTNNLLNVEKHWKTLFFYQIAESRKKEKCSIIILNSVDIYHNYYCKPSHHSLL